MAAPLSRTQEVRHVARTQTQHAPARPEAKTKEASRSWRLPPPSGSSGENLPQFPRQLGSRESGQTPEDLLAARHRHQIGSWTQTPETHAPSSLGFAHRRARQAHRILNPVGERRAGAPPEKRIPVHVYKTPEGKHFADRQSYPAHVATRLPTYEQLQEAIRRFRSIQEATTSPAMGQTLGGSTLPNATTTANFPIHTDKGSPFFGLLGLAQIDRERKRRKSKGQSPAAWEVPVAALPLLRRQPLRPLGQSEQDLSEGRRAGAVATAMALGAGLLGAGHKATPPSQPSRQTHVPRHQSIKPDEAWHKARSRYQSDRDVVKHMPLADRAPGMVHLLHPQLAHMKHLDPSGRQGNPEHRPPSWTPPPGVKRVPK